VVCGSTAHPSPAGPAPDAVTEDDIAEARETLDSSINALKMAESVARAAGEQHAAALARADGKSVDELQALLDDATVARTSAQAAVTESERLARRQEELTAESAELATAATILREQRDAVDRNRTGLI